MQRLSARSSRPVYMSTNPHSRAIWIFGMQPRANAPKCRYQTITLSVCVASWAHFRDIPMDITILLMFILTHKDQSAAQHMHKQRHQHTRFIEWSQREKKHDIDIYIDIYIYVPRTRWRHHILRSVCRSDRPMMLFYIWQQQTVCVSRYAYFCPLNSVGFQCVVWFAVVRSSRCSERFKSAYEIHSVLCRRRERTEFLLIHLCVPRTSRSSSILFCILSTQKNYFNKIDNFFNFYFFVLVFSAEF